MEDSVTLGFDQTMETFCHMVIEEFLMKKNLRSTLRELRSEWERPPEDVTMFSWYNVALKLQMPEILSSDGEEMSVLENIVKTLASESSVRTRRPVEVTMSGLATMPKSSTLPLLSEPQQYPQDLVRPPVSSTVRARMKASSQSKTKSSTAPAATSTAVTAPKVAPTNKSPTKFSSSSTERVLARISSDTGAIIPSKLERILIEKYTASAKMVKPSAENWVPDHVRMKFRMRDLKIINQNVDETIQRELDTKRTLKGVNISAYDKAVNEESLNMVKKIPCACCLQKYLYVNLPLKVSEKAIIDIRVMWTGGMTSSTVWGRTLEAIVADTFEAIHPGSAGDGAGAGEGTTSVHQDSLQSHAITTKATGKLATKKKIPEITPIKVYRDVRVCLFCSQFFQEQEKFRPSFQDMVRSEKRAARQIALAREREYWDPLKMVEKDREEEEKLLAHAEQSAGRVETPILDTHTGADGGNED